MEFTNLELLDKEGINNLIKTISRGKGTGNYKLLQIYNNLDENSIEFLNELWIKIFKNEEKIINFETKIWENWEEIEDKFEWTLNTFIFELKEMEDSDFEARWETFMKNKVENDTEVKEEEK